MTNQISPEVLQMWNEGIKNFNAGEFWLAHENWEYGWKGLPSPLKEHLQGCIQVCGALVHFQNEKMGPAQSLCRLALEKFHKVQKLDDLTKPYIEIENVNAFLTEIVTAAGIERTASTRWLKKSAVLKARLHDES